MQDMGISTGGLVETESTGKGIGSGVFLSCKVEK
jgi:hypothetical protein